MITISEAIERYQSVKVFTHQFSDGQKSYEVFVETFRPVRAAGCGASYISVQDALEKAVKEHDHNHTATLANSASRPSSYRGGGGSN